jgi:potassium efflux system protein
MLMLSLLEDERESFAIRYILFRQSPKMKLSPGFVPTAATQQGPTHTARPPGKGCVGTVIGFDLSTVTSKPLSQRAITSLKPLLVVLPLLLVLLPTRAYTLPPDNVSPSTNEAAPAPGGPAFEHHMSEDELAQRVSELIPLAERDNSAAALDLLRKAEAYLADAKAAHQSTEAMLRGLEQAPALAREITQSLETPLTDAMLPGGDLAELERQLHEAQAQLDAARRKQDSLQQESAARAQRRASIPERIAAGSARIEAIVRERTLPVDPAEDRRVIGARFILLRAEEMQLKALAERLETELRYINERTDLLRANRQLAERRVLEAQKLVEQLATRVADMRAQAASQAQRMAQTERLTAINAHPAVRAVAEQNAALAEDLKRVADQTRALAQDRQRANDERDRWTREFERAKERLAKLGMADAFGIWLRRQRRELPDSNLVARRVEQRKRDMTSAQIRQLAWEDRLLELVDVEVVVENLLAQHADEGTDEQEGLSRAVRDALFAQKRDYLDPLVRAYDSYIGDTLLELVESEQALLKVTLDLREFIDEHILWIQSTPPLTRSEIGEHTREFLSLFTASRWSAVYRTLRRDVRKAPWILPPALLLFTALLFLQPRIRRSLWVFASVEYRRQVGQWHTTLVTAMLTVLLALIWPMLLWTLEWRLAVSASPDEPLVGTLATALGFTGLMLFLLELLRLTCRRKGLAERHWRWSARNTRLLRRNLAWAEPLAVVLTFGVSLTANMPVTVSDPAAGRLTFIMLMIVIALFTARVLHPGSGLFSEAIAARPHGWLAQLRNVWYPAAWGLPVAMAVLATTGYYYTAIRFTDLLLSTAGLLLAAIFVYEMSLRWTRVTRARMALAETRQKTAESEALGAGDGVPPDSEEAFMDIATMSHQTLRLLRMVVGSALLVGFVLIWADVLPALNILRSIELWQVETGAASQAAAAGAKALNTANSVTLAEVVLALLILAGTVILAINMPGLLEFTVLQHLPFSASSRFAIVNSLRYVLVIIGVIMGFNAIDIGWSKVQWLVAAVSVGLGFGLQEIFANLVSGLVIMYERPIRVGDTVTLGNVDGTITRIRIRATTVTDWDNKELIVPNKDFITGRLVNWTLTDPVTRLMFPVGIAHGSDTRLARDLLMRCARECPYVLDEPPPFGIFRGIEESSLRLQLRVFIEGLDHYLEVMDDLYTRIDDAFREHGIVVAFPQRDIHVRTVPETPLEKGLPGRIHAIS